MRRWIAIAILVGAVGACGPLCGNGKLNLSNAQVGPSSFNCPVNATDYAYSLKGSIDADNQTSQNITIKSMTTTATVTKLNGPKWEISVGQKSGDDQVTFSPKSVSSGSKSTIKFTTGWKCTNPGTAPANTYADFALAMTLVTSAGTYTIKLPGGHRMKMA